MRLLQQTLRTSQQERQRPAPEQGDTAAAPSGEVTQLESVLQERDSQIQSLCGHMERIVLEKDSLQQELKALKNKVGEMNERLGMLMETIQAKDEVIMRLSQGSEQCGSPHEGGSPTFCRDQTEELDVLKVRFDGWMLTPKGRRRAEIVFQLAEPVPLIPGQSPRLQIPEQVPEQGDPGAGRAAAECREQREGSGGQGTVSANHKNRKSCES